MHRSTIEKCFVFVGLVAAGVAGRFLFLDTPNFAATAAVASFAGFYFDRRRTALIAPLLVMAISNLWLDAYTTWGTMLTVYAAFFFPALLSHQLRSSTGNQRQLCASRFAVCAVAPSLVFFAATNLAVWVFDGHYAMTLGGLVQCYVQAVPFYKFTLAGDVICTATVFGTCWAIWRLATVRVQTAVSHP